MTVNFDTGEFWIDSVIGSIDINDAVGRYDSAVVNLSKTGRYVSGSCMLLNAPNSDNVNRIGGMALINGSGAVLVYGAVISGVILRIQKLAGTSGLHSLNFQTMILLRK